MKWLKKVIGVMALINLMAVVLMLSYDIKPIATTAALILNTALYFMIPDERK